MEKSENEISNINQTENSDKPIEVEVQIESTQIENGSNDNEIGSDGKMKRIKVSLMPKFRHHRLQPLHFKSVRFPLKKTNKTIEDKRTEPMEKGVEIDKKDNESNAVESIEPTSNEIINNDDDDDDDDFSEKQSFTKELMDMENPVETFEPIGDEINEQSGPKIIPKHFEVVWRNLRYYPPNAKLPKNGNDSTKKSIRPILNNINGMFRSGELTCIMGPSGSGKTVLLNCIANFLQIDCQKQNTGDIIINGKECIRISFVEQFDHLFSYLTVEETLMFSSKILNAARYYLNHEKIVNNIMKKLDLLDIRKYRISKCSNGQKKRISIAIELVYQSDILMLDEPTTGVDSVNGYYIMSILKPLTKRNKAMAILATIHQPSPRIFSLIDNLILLSCEGTIIFQGHPNNLNKTFQYFNITWPLYTSQSDFALEVASGDSGQTALHLLAKYNNDYNHSRFTDDFNEIEMYSLREAVKKASLFDKRSTLYCTLLVIWRNIICNYRNPFCLKIRIVSLSCIVILLWHIFGNDIGKISTCFSKYILWQVEIERLFETFQEYYYRSRENVTLMFLIALMALFNSMLNLVIMIPEEIPIFRREYNNYSYSIMVYYISKIISEIPFTITTTALFVLFVHLTTGQILDKWSRVLAVILPLCLINLNGIFIGTSIGVIFCNHPLHAVISVTFILVPVILCSGFFKMININPFMDFLSNISFLRPSLNAVLIAIFGLGRCDYENVQELELINHKFNSTGQFERPDWIDRVIPMLKVIDTEGIMKSKTIANEEKLYRFMGLKNASDENIPMVLQYLKIGHDWNDYWNQIIELILHCIFSSILLFIIMTLRLKRKKN